MQLSEWCVSQAVLPSPWCRPKGWNNWIRFFLDILSHGLRFFRFYCFNVKVWRLNKLEGLLSGAPSPAVAVLIKWCRPNYLFTWSANSHGACRKFSFRCRALRHVRYQKIPRNLQKEDLDMWNFTLDPDLQHTSKRWIFYKTLSFCVRTSPTIDSSLGKSLHEGKPAPLLSLIQQETS